MVQAKRVDDYAVDALPGNDPLRSSGFAAGGQVGLLQGQLARRLLSSPEDLVSAEPEGLVERVVRWSSRAAGYLSLAAAVGTVAFLLS